MSDSPRMVYLPADAPTLEQIEARVVARFPQAQPARDEGELRLTFGDWTARVVDLREAWVADEAKELAGRAPAEAHAALAASTHRLEIYGSGDADRDDDHYNDALLLWEELTELPDAVGVDPFDGSVRVSAAPAEKEATKRAAPAKKAAAKTKPVKKAAKAAAKKPAKKAAAKKPAKKAAAKKPAKKAAAKKPAKKAAAKKKPAAKSARKR